MVLLLNESNVCLISSVIYNQNTFTYSLMSVHEKYSIPSDDSKVSHPIFITYLILMWEELQMYMCNFLFKILQVLNFILHSFLVEESQESPALGLLH